MGGNLGENFLVVYVHACGFIHVYYSWQTWVEFFSCVVCHGFRNGVTTILTPYNMFFMLFLIFVIVHGHALAPLLFLVMSHSIIVTSCVFIHFYCCSWSCFRSSLLFFNMAMLLFVSIIAPNHVIVHLCYCSWSWCHSSLFLFMVMFSFIFVIANGCAFTYLCYC